MRHRNFEDMFDEHRNGTIRAGTQAGTGDSTTTNNSVMDSYRNMDLE